MQLSAARVFVRDLVAAQEFYEKTLGLRLVAGSSSAGFCVFAVGECQLVVEAVPPDAPQDEQVLVGRFTGLSFAVSDIAAEYSKLLKRGVPFSGVPEQQPWGGILATLRDPAGNELQLVQLPSAA